jgi:two-component system response regulator FixJ
MAARIDIVDDDREMRDSLAALLTAAGYAARTYASAESLLKDLGPMTACIVADMHMPEMNGIALLSELTTCKSPPPIIFITGFGNVPLAVRSLQAGAVDFLEKPFTGEAMLASIRRALALEQSGLRHLQVEEAQNALAYLTCRERIVLSLLVDGCSNKVAAHELGLSPRTIESHRASIMKKMNARNLSDVVRVALAARWAIGTNSELSAG